MWAEDGRRCRDARLGASFLHEEECEIRKKVARTAKRGGFTLGREKFAKISAVEGIVLTPAMHARVEEFDDKDMSAEERRAAIIRAHRKKVGCRPLLKRVGERDERLEAA